MRYMRYIMSSVVALCAVSYSSYHLYAQYNNTTINLSVAYAITGSVFFTWSDIINSGNDSYISWSTIGMSIIASTGWMIYRTIQWSSWWSLSWIDTIDWSDMISWLVINTDGIYTVEGYMETSNNGRYPLTPKTLMIDRTWPSRSGTTQSTYTTHVWDTISIDRWTWYDSGIGWDVQYSYEIQGISTSNTGTTLRINSSTIRNPLNTTILPLGLYMLKVSAYDRLGNATTMTGMMIDVQATNNITGSNIWATSWAWWWTPVLMRDICLCGDYSSTYYDRRCSADSVHESLYMNAYCHNGWTGDQSITAWSRWTWGSKWQSTIPSVEYIKTVIWTLGPNADRIIYSQYNKQDITINQLANTTVTGTNQNTEVLGYSIARPDKWSLGKVTLLIDSLKNTLPYYGIDQSQEWWYNGTMCYANGNKSGDDATLFEIIRWWILRLQYCTRWWYLTIGILLAILLKHTKLYYYKDHDHMILSLNQPEEQTPITTHKKSHQKFDK